MDWVSCLWEAVQAGVGGTSCLQGVVQAGVGRTSCLREALQAGEGGVSCLLAPCAHAGGGRVLPLGRVTLGPWEAEQELELMVRTF